MATSNDSRVIFEFVSVGAYVKVSAIDTVTGTEVSIVGNPRSGEAMLRRTALQKLKFVLEKKRTGGQT